MLGAEFLLGAASNYTYVAACVWWLDHTGYLLVWLASSLAVLIYFWPSTSCIVNTSPQWTISLQWGQRQLSAPHDRLEQTSTPMQCYTWGVRNLRHDSRYDGGGYFITMCTVTPLLSSSFNSRVKEDGWTDHCSGGNFNQGGLFYRSSQLGFLCP